MIQLANNQKRAISSTIRVLEKSVNEMIFILSNKIKECTYEISQDINEENKAELLISLKNLKKFINDFAAKYSLENDITYHSQIFNSKKTFWQIYLEEISSYSLIKKYGSSDFDTKNYDNEINFLINYIKSI